MKTFDSLLPLLVAAIPRAVTSLNLTKPLCILRIYYYDTCAPYAYLSLRAVTVECRDDVVESQGDDAPEYIWGSGEECGEAIADIPPYESATKEDKEITTLFKKVYSFLCEDDHEEENMVRYREFVRKVARELNSKVDWTTVCPVSDDFVVVPADGSMAFGGCDLEDLEASVPAERVGLLRSKGLLEDME